MATSKHGRNLRNGGVPNATIAELYGYGPETFEEPSKAGSIARKCPFRDSECNVTANRHHTAYIDLDAQKAIPPADKLAITTIYGESRLPLGICSCWTKRQNESSSRPWILCPKRLLALEPPQPVIPREVRALVQIPEGSRVGVWPEVKFRSRDQSPSGNNRFFEYTFDYLLMRLDGRGRPSGEPYIVEVMTSSTRGGGLTQHMADVLLGRPQRHLGGVVDSIYTPNYRQVFERMLGQFVAKSEIAEKWGGRTIWVFQDVLLDYIEQTTAFNSAYIPDVESSNVFAEVYALETPSTGGANAASGLHLRHHKSLRGRARLSHETNDYTAFLGLGYGPPLQDLHEMLHRRQPRSIDAMHSGNYFEFTWGEDRDPRVVEPITTQTN